MEYNFHFFFTRPHKLVAILFCIKKDPLSIYLSIYLEIDIPLRSVEKSIVV